MDPAELFIQSKLELDEELTSFYVLWFFLVANIGVEALERGATRASSFLSFFVPLGCSG